FGLPYVVAKSGIIPALFYFLLVGGIVMLLHLCMGEVCLRTKEKYRLVGYANMYLGLPGKILVTFTALVGTTGTLLVYLILGGKFLAMFFPGALSIEILTVLLGLALSFLILQGIQLISKIEFFTNAALFLAVFLILLFSLPHLKAENFSLISFPDMFLPYGVMFFAFIGWAAVPEIAELFKTHKEKGGFEKAIIWSSVLSVLLCAVFSFVVVGVSGTATTEDALTGLVPFFGVLIVAVGAFFGLMTIADSFLIFGNYLKNSLKKDYGMPDPVAFLLATGAPILLFLLGVRELIQVISIVGVFIGTIEGGVILAMFWQAKKKGSRTPEFSLSLPLTLVLFLGLMLVLGAAAEFLA
ncbi:MAG: hypothetical protein Q7S63_00625, partial [bacterium]|nr:hypothetical protein [bacterium]